MLVNKTFRDGTYTVLMDTRKLQQASLDRFAKGLGFSRQGDQNYYKFKNNNINIIKNKVHFNTMVKWHNRNIVTPELRAMWRCVEEEKYLNSVSKHIQIGVETLSTAYAARYVKVVKIVRLKTGSLSVNDHQVYLLESGVNNLK